MSIFDRLFHPRDKPTNTLPGSAFSFLFGGSSSGKAVNERTAMQTTAVYACVRILAETVASLPLHTYKYTAMGKEKALTLPLFFLLHDVPNPEMTSFVFRETLMSHLLIYCNAYAQIVRDGAGRVMGLYPLMSDQMRVDRMPTGVLFYEYRKDSGYTTLRPDQVLHIPGLGFDGLVGYSPIAMTKNAIGIAMATEEYGAAFFANGANPGGVLEHPGVLKDPAKLRDSWNHLYRGSNNSSRIAVLEEGIKYKQISIPRNRHSFLQTRKYQLNEIARIFRIPLHMIGDLEKSSFSNIDQQSLEYVKYTLDPLVTRWEQAMQKALLLPSEKREYFIKFTPPVICLLRNTYLPHRLSDRFPLVPVQLYLSQFRDDLFYRVIHLAHVYQLLFVSFTYLRLTCTLVQRLGAGSEIIYVDNCRIVCLTHDYFSLLPAECFLFL